MMKKLLFLPLALATLVAVSSCHGTKSANGNVHNPIEVPEEFDDTREYNLTFWSKNDSNEVQLQTYKNAISSFNKYYPNIHIEMVSYSNYNDIYTAVLNNVQTNTTPNIAIAYPDHVATYLQGNDIVCDLNSLMSNKNYGLGGSDVKFDSVSKDEITKKFLDEGIIDGFYYTLPFLRSSECMYINKGYVEKLFMQGYLDKKEIPAVPTWEWLWKVCDAAVKAKQEELAANPSADAKLYPFIYKSADNLFITLCKQYDYDYIDSDGNALFFNDEGMLDKMAEFTEYGMQGYYNIFARISYPANYYNKWEAVAVVDSTAGSTWIGDEATVSDAGSKTEEGEYEKIETVVRPIPQKSAEDPVMISQGPSICLFNKEDKQEVVASWLFAQYLLTNDTQIAYSKTEGYLPVTTRAIQSEEFQAYLNDSKENHVKLDATKLIEQYTENTFITPVFNGSANLRDVTTRIFWRTFSNNVRIKNADGTPNHDGIKNALKTVVYPEVIKNYNLTTDANGNVVASTNVAVTETSTIGKNGIILLSCIGAVWILIAAYFITSKIKGRKKKNA